MPERHHTAAELTLKAPWPLGYPGKALACALLVGEQECSTGEAMEVNKDIDPFIHLSISLFTKPS